MNKHPETAPEHRFIKASLPSPSVVIDKLVMTGKRKFWGVVVVLLIAITAADLVLREAQFLSEGAPLSGRYPMLRTLMIFFLALAVVLHATRSSTSRLSIGHGDGYSPTRCLPALFAVGIVLVASACLAIDPLRFNRLSQEDGIAETASFMLLLLASMVLLESVWRVQFLSSQQRHRISSTVKIGVFLLAATCFVIAMEEISWGQRVAGFETPAWIAQRNFQGEFNLHNFLTNQVENVYYTGAFVLLLFLFVIRGQLEPALPMAGAGLLFPGGGTAIIGAMTTTLSFGMWNFLWIQMCFFVAVLTLLFAAVACTNEERQQRRLLLVSTGVLCCSQMIDLVLGNRMLRNWDDTEIKELLIALGMFAYSLEVSRNIRFQMRAA